MDLLPLEALLPERENPHAVKREPPSLTAKTKTKRSRMGCLSCKKLKIKCDEAKPSCEYCTHTSRICVYPVVVDKKKPTRKKSGLAGSPRTPDVIDLSSPFIVSLNSMQKQMSVSRFELKLLRFYMDFGGGLFTANKSSKVRALFDVDAPRLWQQYELVRSAIYSCATLYLWKFYEMNYLSNVYLTEDQHLVLQSCSGGTATNSLYNITENYLMSTMNLMKESIAKLHTDVDEDTVGALMLSNVMMFAVLSIHPMSPAMLVKYHGSSSLMNDILEISSGIFQIYRSRAKMLQGSRYKLLLYEDELSIVPPPGQETLFPFVANLRSYLNNVVTSIDGNFTAYHQAVNAIDDCCYRALAFNYVLPVLRGMMVLADNINFVSLIRSRDFIAMKIMYTYCCVVSICGIKMFHDVSVWNSYIEEFKVNSELMFGGFEDDFDRCLYHQVQQRIMFRTRRLGEEQKVAGKPFLDPRELRLIGTTLPLESEMPYQ
ncbi:Zn(II)2Cys6 transcription factor domain-containing protein CYBJADRAFT_165353 [Cyberlindnera jadinii NRRL Y-1542]|uniref:Zn(2)-C6 fungal-type domain-containing protein n=1 Tax=Cyberlindnera jadinii (strain ATCC 18201 / CBS 1600 / BCRC 20928 / JCM 3617 / NBRC 0987 / NRRL Y-1542) TaxID=983966 RepID=A0A1E4S901_CYBJN|nr:hypothetical protein CYBJADRAFT_165353 [Cyberlindnera jadinii NRRL Y-1542]ODV75979.1 hypothetical protein CYBJADRAFT_165353 [Cyberlindnera jadinii NRRL Y-1542]